MHPFKVKARFVEHPLFAGLCQIFTVRGGPIGERASTFLFKMNCKSRKSSATKLVLTGIMASALAVPALANGAIARAADNEPEAAADALYGVVAASYKKQASGRSIETDCSGRRNTFSCQWWIIKGAREKRMASAAEVLARRGEGSQHYRATRVYMSGYATATYNAKTRGYSIRLG